LHRPWPGGHRLKCRWRRPRPLPSVRMAARRSAATRPSSSIWISTCPLSCGAARGSPGRASKTRAGDRADTVEKSRGAASAAGATTARRPPGIYMKPRHQKELAQEILSREVGYVRKPHANRLRVALIFPNTYFVAMSNLGFQTMYRLFNDQPDIVCERAF